MNKSLIFSILISLLSLSAIAQKTQAYAESNTLYTQALDLYNKGKYNMAKDLFIKVQEMYPDKHNLLNANAQFYRAACAIHMDHPDAEHQVITFIKLYPGHPKINEAKFILANHYYNRKKWKSATKWYEQVDRDLLTDPKHGEYNFKIGYCYFNQKELDTARVFLYEIKDMDTEFTPAAIYYYSHINYLQKNYQTALEGFLRLKDDPTFASIVPYYVSQIYYYQGKYNEVTTYAPPLLEKITKSRKPEMQAIIGDAYYQIENYSEAIPYLEQALAWDKYSSRKSNYLLAFSYYKTEQYLKAIDYFERVINTEDEISQNAFYHLADCYLKTDRKKNALMAFSRASKMDFNAEIKKDALLNYGMLAYEISYDPFNEALTAFNTYLELYPYSPRVQDVYNYLVQVYLSTNNYEEAISFLDKIEFKDTEIKRAYQRAAFYRALELYTQLEFTKAMLMFNKSLEYQEFDRVLTARAHYWLGEIAYRNKQFSKAIENYNKFFLLPSTYYVREYAAAHYNIAYAYFNTKNYQSAQMWFKKYAALSTGTDLDFLADTYNRLGDIYFSKSSYKEAIEQYDKNIKIRSFGLDYSLFQKGFCLGLQGNQTKKREVLTTLLSNHPTSLFCDDATYELGESFNAAQKYNKAIEYYEKLIADYPESSYTAKSLLKLGLIYYNLDNNDKAIASYKQVVNDFPATTEAKYALNGMKNIYLDQGNVDPYLDYISNLNTTLVEVSEYEKDSLKFKAVENLYQKGDCEKSVTGLEKYLTEFPNGSFVLHTHFYKADCYYRMQEYDKALESFEYIAGQPRNQFTEQSLVGAAWINFTNKNYEKALANYQQLEKAAEIKANIREARMGMMRCNFILEKYEDVITNASILLKEENRDENFKREAWYKMATSFFKTNDLDNALVYYYKLAIETSSSQGAESKYRIAEIQFEQKKYEDSKETILDFLDMNSPHQYWLAKAFLLLSDILLEEGDEFQATHTIKSIMDNYNIPDDGIIDLAKEKLQKIEDAKPKDPDATNDNEMVEEEETVISNSVEPEVETEDPIETDEEIETEVEPETENDIQ